MARYSDCCSESPISCPYKARRWRREVAATDARRLDRGLSASSFSCLRYSLRQIVRANENRPIHLGVAGNVFPAYLLLNDLAVRSEHFEFIHTVSMEVVVQGFSADGAAHPRFAIVSVEKDNVALGNKSLLGREKCQVVLLKAPLHAADDKGCERMDVHLDAGAVHGAQIRLAIPDANHCPRIAARCQHSVHEEACHAAVPVRVRVDITEKPVS